MRYKTAVIGSGIAGLTAAYTLSTSDDVTLFEKEDYIGGHSRTIDVNLNGQIVPSDTGFIVFNDRNYPLLHKLFAHLDVVFEKSDMSFGVSIREQNLEYSSSSIFAQGRNFIRPKFWRMLFDIIRFNKNAPHWLAKPDMSLGQLLDEMKAGQWFCDYYLQAMGAAIWSCSSQTIRDFPAHNFIRFFQNHGLLTIFNQPQWYTVSGGSREYIKKILARLPERIHVNTEVVKVVRTDNHVQTHLKSGGIETFDRVVFACHADQALSLLDSPEKLERDILGAFTYQTNKIIVHGDESFMPKRKKAWASWVYLSDHAGSVSLSYWMNNLQNKEKRFSIIETLNPMRRPNENLIYDEHVFRHPVFTKEAIEAQAKIPSLQGLKNCYYCGAWQKNGFHEDGVASAVAMLKTMNAPIEWL